jgi:hypothetical protein
MQTKAKAIAKTLLSASAVVMISLATSGSSAAEIYKWTDAEGNVQYGDRPSGEATEVRLQIASNPTDPARLQAQAAARQQEADYLAQAAVDNEPTGPTREEIATAAKEKADKCNTYRERMNDFLRARHLYREDASGERVYLDESEMAAAREKVEGQVQEYCGS